MHVQQINIFKGAYFWYLYMECFQNVGPLVIVLLSISLLKS